MVNLSMIEEEIIYGEKTSSINGVGKTGQLHVKEWNLTTFTDNV